VQKVLDGGVVPPNLSNTVLRPDQFKHGYVQSDLSARGLDLWETAWAQVKST
jgi:hypothetical protein